MHQLDELATIIHAQNVARGWWDDPDRCLQTVCMLIVSELAEAMEGDRKNLMDDHLPNRPMVEVEIADAFIRLLDLGGKLQLKYTPTHLLESYVLKNVPAGLLRATKEICFLSDAIGLGHVYSLDYIYSKGIDMLQVVGVGYDVIGALHEKLEYNKKRADHNRDARQQENGKRY
jgi:hypothetical protein